jgi:hypothetical protein
MLTFCLTDRLGAFQIVAAVIANREAVKQSRRLCNGNFTSGLLRLRLAMTDVEARNDGSNTTI